MKNAAAPRVGSRFIACLASILFLCIAAPADAQFAQTAQFALAALFAQFARSAQAASPVARDSARERAVKRCKENRGVDCESREGLQEWLEQDRRLTAEQQAAVAGARRHREACAKNKNATNC